MKKISKLFTVLLSAVLLFSCSNGFNLSDNMAQVIVNIEDVTSRTAFAPVTSSACKDIKLNYKKTDTSDAYSTAATWENASAMSSTPAYLVPDTYDFQILANVGGFIYKAEKTAVTLVEGLNTIDAQLVLTEMGTSVGTGTFELTLTVPAGLITNSDPVKYVSNNAFFSVYKNGAVLNGYENVACEASSVNTENNTITFKAVSPAGLASGMYDVVIGVYTDIHRSYTVASYEDSIQIVDNLKTEKAYIKQNINVNPDSVIFGSIGENANATYVIVDKKMYICGTGDLEQSSPNEISEGTKVPFDGADFDEVYIGDGITGIRNCFFYKTNVCKVTGCKDVTIIGQKAFFECKSLEEIPAFEKVITVDDMAFSGCSELKEINGFNELRNVENEAFAGCNNLKSVKGFNKVESIPFSFGNCKYLKTISGFNSVQTIRKEDFYYTNTSGYDTKVNLEVLEGFNSITSLASYTDILKFPFGNKSKFKIISGFNNVTEIDESAFLNCSSLETISGFEKLETISRLAFQNCSNLKTISGFGKVITIKESAFVNCSSLTDISVFNNVTTIEHAAFSNCTGLTKIEGFNKVTTLGEHAFTECCNIEEINGFNKLETIPSNVFYVNNSNIGKLKTIKGFNYLKEMPANLFKSSYILESLEGFQNIEKIYNGVFYTVNGNNNINVIFIYYGSKEDYNNIQFPDCDDRRTQPLNTKLFLGDNNRVKCDGKKSEYIKPDSGDNN